MVIGAGKDIFSRVRVGGDEADRLVQDAVRFALEAWEARLVELESVRSN